MFHFFLIVAGLVSLVVGANLLVCGSSKQVLSLGISLLLVGLTIVAFDTSAPEVAVSVLSLLECKTAMATGKVVGSNIFKILGCLGISGVVAGGAGLVVAPSLLAFDIWFMLAVALACLSKFITGGEIARWGAGVFTGYVVAYVAYLILVTQKHDLLGAFSRVMLLFVVQLTVMTRVVTVERRRI
jgi:cation:H+ antiporter